MKVARRWGARTGARSSLAALLGGILAATAVAYPAPSAVAAGTSAAAVPGAVSAAAAVPVSPGSFAGPGFDACTAPPSDLMATWRASSPYRAVGIYVGGVNRACQQPELTPGWVATQAAAGWRFVPIYMGLQPQCTTSTKKFRFTPANAAASGRAAADDAVAQLRRLGLPRGSSVFLDVEAYRTDDAPCRTSVLTYQSSWTARMHDWGYLSGFYSSLGSGVADQVAVYGSTSWVRPDYLWFARYDKVAGVTNPAIPDAYWPHRRIKQYQSPTQTGGPETWGGRTLPVDRDQLDLRAVPATPFGDFSGNGWSDLIARDTTTNDNWLYPGNGTRLGSRSRFGNVAHLNAMTRFGDFDGDRREDVVARDRATGQLWLYRGTGTGFAPRVRITGTGWNAMREITLVGDLTGDGLGDLMAVQTSTGCLYLYPGLRTSLGPRTRISCVWKGRSELTGIGDLDRDGRVDLLARTNSTGELWLYPGRVGGLGPRTLVSTGWSGLRDLTGVGDFDRDGVPDLVAVKTATGELFRYPGRKGGLRAGLRIGGGWTNRAPLL